MAGPGLPSFEAALEAFGPEVYRYVRRLVPTADDAADLHQETFLRAFRAYGRLGGGANVRAWLYRIAGNLAADAHRRRVRRPEHELLEASAERPGSTDPEQAARADELRTRVREALLELSPSQRLAVAARVLDGAPYDEVAGLLGCGEDTARQHVSQGLRRLRAGLADWL